MLMSMFSGPTYAPPLFNPLFGVVEAEVGGYSIVITDCYVLEVPPAEHLPAEGDRVETWRFEPCSAAVILIEGDQLTVNSVPYGMIAPGDEIMVDEGDVYVNGQLRRTT